MTARIARLLVALLGTGIAVQGMPAEVYVPDALEPWREWVLAEHPAHACPSLSSSAKLRHCQWTSSLSIHADAQGARFTMEVELFAPADVILPGAPGVWPADVNVTATPGSGSGPASRAVTEQQGKPRVRAEPGRYLVSGRLAWPRLPDAIPIPPRYGVLNVSIDGAPVIQPLVEDGRLWLGRSGAPQAETTSDSLEVRVYRLVEDGVPLTMQTTLQLNVAGAPRVATLGRALLGGFAVTGLQSELPARVDPDGTLRVQVAPGTWEITIDARALAPLDTLATSATTQAWPTQEIWGFASAPELRTVNIEGPPPVDLSQTDAPFQNVPGYLMAPDSAFRLVEQFRGDPNPVPDDYRLTREAWLGFSGDTVVLRDTLNVTAARPSRLAAEFVPGRVTVDGQPQLVTRLPVDTKPAGDAAESTSNDALPGIELPQGQHTVTAISEVPLDDLDTVVGWHVDAGSVETTLHLPPAWRLLWTSGVDRAPTAWLSQWNLWRVFLVTVTVVAAARLLGLTAATLVGLALIVVYQEPGSPSYAWIVLLMLLAGIRVSRTGRIRGMLGTLYFVVLALTAVTTVLFTVDGFRKALYPQLERPYAAIAPQESALGYDMDSRMEAMPAPPAADGSGASLEQVVVTATKVTSPNAPDLYPPDLRVQTGPAVPEWRWEEAPLLWDGPVTAGQGISLTFAPPWLTRSLYVLGPLLLLALLVVFGSANLPPTIKLPPALRRFLPLGGDPAAAAGAAGAVALLLGLGLATVPAAPARAAEIPGAALLQELESRLLAPPPCMPGCASVERAAVRLDGRALEIELVVNAEVAAAVPVLRSDDEWQPASIRRDGEAATVTRDADDRFLVAVAPGRHTIQVSAPVAQLDRFELSFPLLPGNIATQISEWDVFGLDEGRLRGRELQFARAARDGDDGESAGLRGDPVPPYYAVDRALEFGLEWRIMTTVRRVAPAAGVIPFRVPLLPGEAVLSGQVTAADGSVTGVLGPDQTEQQYASALAEAAVVTLTAPSQDVASERWTLVPSNLWHVEHSGVAPAKTAPGETAGPRFAPMPGETLTVRLTRPEAVPGSSVTLSRLALADAPGRRTRHSTLTLRLLASQGDVYPVTLPPDARVLDISANGRPVPIPAGAGPLPLPVVPGDQTITVEWETPAPIAFRTTTSRPELPGVVRNVNLDLTLPDDRWPLLVGGPALGPAITWWGILVSVLLIAVALARVPGLPLTTRDAIVAGVGTALCNLPGAIAIAAWLLVMLVRRLATPRLLTFEQRGYNALQAVLALFSVIAVGMFAASVPYGLLGEPEMYVAGNGSTAHALSWYQDQAEAGLPEAWVISLPLWLYRVAMLAWSLWLAFALVRWIRWAWECWTAGGAWRRDADVTSRIGAGPADPPPPGATAA
jgi:hypothetical protein